jgi:hypothetical protein
MVNTLHRSSAVLRVILVAFAVTASSSYGSCFWGADTSQPQPDMPCHQAENTSEAVDETCCAACVGLQGPSEYTILPLDVAVIVISSRLSARSINAPEPRYRPPIAHFS